MTKNEMENRMHELFAVLMNGSINEYRQAKKDIDSLWRHEHGAFKRAAPVLFEYLPKFDQIENNENKKAFVSGIDLFYLVLGDEHFDVLKDFTLDAIQHPNGHVREAMRHTAEWLYGSLAGRVRPFVYSKRKISQKQQADSELARKQYSSYIDEIKLSLDKYENDYENVEYVNEMKPSVQKSLQQLLSRLIESPCYGEVVRSRPVTLEIFMARKEIERRIRQMLLQTKSEYTFEEVVDEIYREDEDGKFSRIVSMFDNGGHIGELSDILELISDAWNYFPHEILGGLSPSEKVSEYRDKHDLTES